MSSSTFSYARGAPPPLALTRRRRFAALPSGASLGPRALIKRQRNDARACAAAADVRVVAVAGDAAVDHLEADDPPPDAARLLLPQRGGADEVVLLPADDPSEVRLERGRRLVDVVAVEAHRRLEAQRVARAEAARDDVGRSSRLENRLPHAVRRLRRDEDLEAVLASVPGARDRRADAGDFAVR